MVLIRGLDRIDGTSIESLDDDAWQQHTQALQKLFEKEQAHRSASGASPMSLADFAAAFAYLPPLGNDAANSPPVIEQGMCEAKGECCLFKRQKCTLRWVAEALQVCLCLFVLFLSICQSACASSLPVPLL